MTAGEHGKGAADMELLDCESAGRLIEAYRTTVGERFAEACRRVERWEYAVGGELLHRGYYCPSRILDLIAANGGRGRLLKRPTARSRPDYEFGFDAAGRLTALIKRHRDLPDKPDYELILREGDRELGLTFSDAEGIHQVSECIYEGNRLAAYTLIQYSQWIGFSERRTERYCYGSDFLDVEWIVDRFRPEALVHDLYHFSVREGRLTQYTCRELNGRQGNPDRVYEVPVERYVE